MVKDGFARIVDLLTRPVRGRACNSLSLPKASHRLGFLQDQHSPSILRGSSLRSTFQVTPAGDETVVGGDGRGVIATGKKSLCLMITKKHAILQLN